jgi:hypothetical protein
VKVLSKYTVLFKQGQDFIHQEKQLAGFASRSLDELSTVLLDESIQQPGM